MKIDHADSYRAIEPTPNNTPQQQVYQAPSQESALPLSASPAVQPTKQIDKEQEVSKDELIGMLDKVNKVAEAQQVNLRLKVDDDTNKIVVNVVDHVSGDVIRQIPSEHAMKLAKEIDDALEGFFSTKEQLISDKA